MSTNDPTTVEESTDSYHHGDLRNALVAAGLEILTQDGDKTLSLRKVARRAGVSHAAPYRHFSSKEALLTAIAEADKHNFGRLPFVHSLIDEIADNGIQPTVVSHYAFRCGSAEDIRR